MSWMNVKGIFRAAAPTNPPKPYATIPTSLAPVVPRIRAESSILYLTWRVQTFHSKRYTETMKLKSFRKYDKQAFVRQELRQVSQASWSPGDWVRHTPTKTWFEAFESIDLDGTPALIGFGFYNQEVVVPLLECTHKFDPNLDG